jgi:hypothetical protein
MDLIISVAHERDHLSVREPGAGDIFRIYQQHVAGALNASQAVAQSVNRLLNWSLLRIVRRR